MKANIVRKSIEFKKCNSYIFKATKLLFQKASKNGTILILDQDLQGVKGESGKHLRSKFGENHY